MPDHSLTYQIDRRTDVHRKTVETTTVDTVHIRTDSIQVGRRHKGCVVGLFSSRAIRRAVEVEPSIARTMIPDKGNNWTFVNQGNGESQRSFTLRALLRRAVQHCCDNSLSVHSKCIFVDHRQSLRYGFK